MRVLFVADRAWPATGGSLVYVQAMAERLVQAGHTVKLLTTDAGELAYFWNPRAARVAAARSLERGVPVERYPVRHTPLPALSFPALRYLNAMLGALPFVPPRVLFALARLTPHVPDLERALAELDEPFDLVHAINLTLDSISLAAAQFARRRGLPLVLTPFVHTGIPRFYTMRHQLELLRQAEVVIAQTPLEKNLLAARGIAPGKIHVIGAFPAGD